MATTQELNMIYIQEFASLQNSMMLAKKENALTTYESLKSRYIVVKTILTSNGVNLTEIDFIKE